MAYTAASTQEEVTVHVVENIQCAQQPQHDCILSRYASYRVQRFAGWLSSAIGKWEMSVVTVLAFDSDSLFST